MVASGSPGVCDEMASRKHGLWFSLIVQIGVRGAAAQRGVVIVNAVICLVSDLRGSA